MKKYKYNNWPELIAAFREGDLEGWSIYMDDDYSVLTWTGPMPNFIFVGARSLWRDQKDKESQSLWRGGGERDIVEALQAAGIPCERACCPMETL